MTDKTKNENLPVDASMFSGMDSGFEGTSAETFKTPFMKVLQQLSPELKKKSPEYIEGAEAGMFCNSATKELYTELNVVILKVEHSLISWKPDRGGFAGRSNKALEGDVVSDVNGLQKWDTLGNEVVDTIEFFCLNIDNPADVFILSLSRASYKHARSFATRLRMLKADGKPVNVSWAGVWNIRLTEEKNDKGEWYTIGNTPTFTRFINRDERDKLVMPAKELLATADIDYKIIESSESSDGTDKY